LRYRRNVFVVSANDKENHYLAQYRIDKHVHSQGKSYLCGSLSLTGSESAFPISTLGVSPIATIPARLYRCKQERVVKTDESLQTGRTRVGARHLWGKGDIVGEELPVVYLARHGETAWSLTGQYTGLTDLPLTEQGERTARRLGERLKEIEFAKVFTSPLQRAARTCELAGFGAVAEIDPDLVEWNYGEYEGRRTAEIVAERPGWLLFRDGCPGGEMPAQVAARADRVVRRVRAVNDNVLLFTSGHFMRVLAARWIGLEPSNNSRSFALSTASLSALGYEGSLSRPAIVLWNETRHVTHDSLQPSGSLREEQAMESSRR
jgi:broad specificity phosphatase PhoE